MNRPILKSTLLTLMLLMLTACAGGGDNDGPIGTGVHELSGTVAEGRALGRVTVTLKDASGNTITTETDSSGRYRFTDIDDLPSPYFLRAGSDDDKALFSMAVKPGIANIHPLSDVTIRNWFRSKHGDEDLDDAFINDGPLAGDVAEEDITAIVDVIESLLRLAYLKFGVDADFDFLRSPFTAKHINDDDDETVAGDDFDLLLDSIKVKIRREKLTIYLTDPETGISGTILVKFDLERNLTDVDVENPSAPTGVTVIPGGSDSLVLLWNSSVDNVGIAGYKIYKNGSEQPLASSPYPLYVDEFTWQAGTEYCYEVQAYDAAGNSSEKVETCFLATDDANIDPPLPASDLTATPLGGKSMGLSWTPSPDDVIGYDVYRKPATAAGFVKVFTSVASAYDDHDLEPETQYCFYVEAIKVVKTGSEGTFTTVRSEPSNTVCASTLTENTGDVDPPTSEATPRGASFDLPVEVSLACTDAGGSGCSAIYYTVDGSTPTTSSNAYDQPLLIRDTTLLKYFAVDNAGNVEDINYESYVIDLTDVFIDDFEDQDYEGWTLGGRQQGVNTSGVVDRNGSYKAYLSQSGISEIGLYRLFVFEPSMTLSFEMEAVLTPDSGDASDLYSAAMVKILFNNTANDQTIGRVAYWKSSSSYPFTGTDWCAGLAYPPGTCSLNRLTEDGPTRYTFDVQDLLSQLDINESQIGIVRIQFDAYTSSASTSFKTQMWIDDVFVSPGIPPEVQ